MPIHMIQHCYEWAAESMFQQPGENRQPRSPYTWPSICRIEVSVGSIHGTGVQMLAPLVIGTCGSYCSVRAFQWFPIIVPSLGRESQFSLPISLTPRGIQSRAFYFWIPTIWMARTHEFACGRRLDGNHSTGGCICWEEVYILAICFSPATSHGVSSTYRKSMYFYRTKWKYRLSTGTSSLLLPPFCHASFFLSQESEVLADLVVQQMLRGNHYFPLY